VDKGTPSHAVANVLGIFAIAFWSCTVPVSRILTESLGTITAGACTFLLAGVLGCGYLLASGGMCKALRTPRAYLLGCGGVFVVYTISLYVAIGLSRNRQQAIEVGIINYLWPAATLLLSVPILKKRARLSIVPGIVIAFAGVALAMSQTAPFSWALLRESLLSNPAPYALGFVAAFTWGLYSTLSRRYAADRDGGAVPLFIIATGIALAAARPFFSEQMTWSPRVGCALLYMAVCPALLAYTFWDIGMRRGNITLIAALSYLTPLLMTSVSGLLLGVEIGPSLLIAATLVILGAAICKVSIIEPEAGTE